MKSFLTILILACVIVGGIGCGSKDDSGISSEVANEMTSLGDAARKAGGDFDKLGEADKKKFVDRAGTEEGARAMVKQMTGANTGTRGPQK